MKFEKLQFRPGINREVTDYANGGGWHDCDKVRFRFGKPEKIGGWTRLTSSVMDGVARALWKFRTLTGVVYMAVGTTKRLYLEKGEDLNDITPLRDTEALTDPFTTTNGSTEVSVADVGHNALLGDLVEFVGSSAVGGVAADDLNTVHEITEITDADNYKIVVANAATSGANGGGSVTANYYISSGINTVVPGTGWGSGTWSRGTWGSGVDLSGAVGGGSIRLWSFDNFGEDLIASVRNGGIYYWNASNGLGNRAFNIADLPGAQNTPQVAIGVMVSDRDRHVVAFGCDPLNDAGTQDPLLIRWSAQENAANWLPSTTNTSGSIKLQNGSGIIGFEPTRQETLVWTDNSVYAFRYVGGLFVFGVTVIANQATIIGMNAAASHRDSVFWMGEDSFYVYSGGVRQIPCTVEEYVFSDLNRNQADKVTASTNSADSEIIWFYPSAGSTENDRYVIYNFQADVWYYGSLARTVYIDVGLNENPIAGSTDGYLYYHEDGLVDGSTSPPSRIDAYIESSPVEIGNGESYAFLSRLIPDITFATSTAGVPAVNMVIKARNAPGAAVLDTETTSVTSSTLIPVEQFDTDKWIRIRGRSFVFRIEDQDDDDNAGTFWRLGDPRVQVRTDGRR